MRGIGGWGWHQRLTPLADPAQVTGTFAGETDFTVMQFVVDLVCCVVLLASAAISDRILDKQVEEIDVSRQTPQDYVGLLGWPRAREAACAR